MALGRRERDLTTNAMGLENNAQAQLVRIVDQVSEKLRVSEAGVDQGRVRHAGAAEVSATVPEDRRNRNDRHTQIAQVGQPLPKPEQVAAMPCETLQWPS